MGTLKTIWITAILYARFVWEFAKVWAWVMKGWFVNQLRGGKS